MPENVEKNTYLRRRLLKSPYYDAQKFWIKHVFKTSPRKHNTMVPKNYS